MAYRIPILEKFCWQEQVLGKCSEPPLTPVPSKGHRYIVENGIGIWTGKNNCIAWHDGTGWKFDEPDIGWQVYNLSAINGEKQTLYDSPDKGWIIASATSADKIKLGFPTDGSFTDGLLDFVSGNLVVNTIDDINEVLRDLAPANALTLNNTNLTSTVNLRVGKLPQKLSSSFYADGSENRLDPGTLINNIIDTPNLVILSPNPDTTFNKGDEGVLQVKHAVGNNIYNIDSSINLTANFDKTIIGSQDISTWNVGCVNGNVGVLEILSCEWYNNFSKWQKMTCRINISTLSPGFNSWKLVHELTMSQETNPLSFYYDDNEDPLNFSLDPELTVYPDDNLILKYISGIGYYTIGNQFTLEYTGENVYKNFYHKDSVSIWNCPGFKGIQIKNPGSPGVNEFNPPKFDEPITYSQIIKINDENIRNIDVMATIKLMHPHKEEIIKDTPSHGYMFNTMPILSTETLETFEDEKYRLPSGEYDNLISNITDQWNSNLVLSNNNALIYNGELQYPNIDLSIKSPIGPNYTINFTGDQVYYRAFRNLNIATNSITLVLDGITMLDMDSNINVSIKLPTQTAWLDIGKYYDPGVLNADGIGCLTVQTLNTWNLTFGTKSTGNSGNMFIMRVTFKNTNAIINQIQVLWVKENING